MSLKLKHVVTFLKITICFLLSRPFGSCVWLLKILAQPIAQQKKGMHNLKVRKKLYAPENCPTPPPSKKIMVHPCSCDENWRIRLPGPSHYIISRICTQWSLEVTSLQVFTPENWKRMWWEGPSHHLPRMCVHLLLVFSVTPFKIDQNKK